MALTITSRGTGTHNTGATTLVPGGRSATLAAGSMGVLAIALDNAGSAGASTISPASWTDDKGNVWTKRINALYDNGAASAGIEMAWYTAPITVALLTTDAGTITWSPSASPVAKAWTWYEVIPSAGNYVWYNTGGNGTGATAANGQITTASVPVGDGVIAGYFSENVAAVTGDSDTTNGTWTAQQTATIGSTTSGVRIATQQKVQTTTASTQSYDVTVTSQDRIVGYIMLSEGINKTGALETGTGTEAAAVAQSFTGTLETGTGTDAASLVVARSATAESGAGSDGSSGSTPPFVCGFENATDYAAHWNDGGTGPHALDSTVADRNGDYALRIDCVNDTTYLLASAAFTARAVTAARFRFRTSALPTASTMRVMKFNGVSVYDPYIFIDSADNRLYFSNGGTNAQGPTVAANTWYTIQVAVDGTNRQGRWSVNGTSQPDPGSAGSNDTHNALYLGKTDAIANGVHSMYYDDVAIDSVWGSYPFADGYVNTNDEWVSTSGGAVLTAAISGSESGTATDSATVDMGATPKTGTLETGTGTDAASAPAAAIAGSESGTGTEAATVDQGTVEKTGTLETGTGTDAALLVTAISGSESGAGTDASTAPTVARTATAESGTGTDTATVTQAIIRYMAPGGSDTNDGSFGSPWATIQKFVDLSPAPGSILYLRDGDYDPATDGFYNSRDTWGNLIGTASNPITIRNYPGEVPSFPNSTATVFSIGPNETSDTMGANYLVIDGIRFPNSDISDEATIRIGGFEPTLRLVKNITIRNCYFSLATTTISTDHCIGIIHNAENVTIEDCEFVGPGGSGQGGCAITVYSEPAAIGTLVQRCVFKDFDNAAVAAIQVWDYATTPIATIEIKHCSFISNAYAVDLRYHSTATLIDNAWDVASGSTALYDPNNSGSTSNTYAFYSQTFTAGPEYALVPGDTAINGASDGTNAGWTQRVIVSTRSDSGAGTETASVSLNVPATESGTASDAAALAVALALADSGTGTESATIAAVLSATAETGTGTETASQNYPLSATLETGTGTETASVDMGTVEKTGTLETGTGTDASSAPTAEIAGAETGTGTETASLDTGATQKTGSLETGTGTDASTAPTVARTATAESGAGSDIAALVYLLANRTESGTGTDASSREIAVGGSEVVTGVDASTAPTVTQTAADSAVGVDLVFAMDALLNTVTDSATAQDAGLGVNELSVSDSATSIETAVAALSVPESDDEKTKRLLGELYARQMFGMVVRYKPRDHRNL